MGLMKVWVKLGSFGSDSFADCHILRESHIRHSNAANFFKGVFRVYVPRRNHMRFVLLLRVHRHLAYRAGEFFLNITSYFELQLETRLPSERAAAEEDWHFRGNRLFLDFGCCCI